MNSKVSPRHLKFKSQFSVGSSEGKSAIDDIMENAKEIKIDSKERSPISLQSNDDAVDLDSRSPHGSKT